MADREFTSRCEKCKLIADFKSGKPPVNLLDLDVLNVADSTGLLPTSGGQGTVESLP